MRNAVRKGFTIVEMLMVLGIIAVLLGLVTSAATSAIKHARDHKASACQQIIQAGIASYRAQLGEWPGRLKSLSENGVPNNKRYYTLETSEYDQVISEVVKESVNGNGTPLMDVNGLIVAPKSSNGSWGIEFREAVKKQKKHGGKIKVSDMAFGYQDSSGHFHRFTITYNPDADNVTVSK